jgi:trigger factor
MTDVKLENLEKNQVKLTFTIPQADILPHLEEAAKRLSEKTQIPGFRPGKAGFEVVKNRVGEMKIYEEALETIVRTNFVKALLDHSIDTVGSPKIDVEKLAPGNDVVFTAEVSRMPEVTRLAEYKKISVEPKKIETTEKEIDHALNDLRRMQTKEVRAEKDAAATQNDKIVVSMGMKKDGVPVEGGQSPNHVIFLNEEYYIPGLKEQVIGMKEGEEKSFSLPFPKDHVQKMLAGSTIDFEVGLKEIFHLDMPEADEEFAKALGQPDLKTMRELIRTNIQNEKLGQETYRQEKEMLEAIAKDSRFDDIPDLLLNEELRKMVQELQHGVEKQGGDFENYVKSLGKSLADLKLEFTPQALLRIKVALIIKKIAEDEKIEAEEKEIDEELDRMAAQHEDENVRKQIFSPEYREYVSTMLRNRKVISMLRSVMVK